MKKKMMMALCAAAGAALLSVSAFAGEVTVDDVLAGYSAASKEATQFTSAVDMKADASIDVPDMQTTFGMTADGAMDIACTIDPINIATTGNFNVSAAGSDIAVDLQLYMVTEEDGSLGTYSKTSTSEDEEASWSYDTVPAEDAAAVLQMIRSADIDLSKLPIQFTLGEGTVEAQGHECYQLLAALTGEDLLSLVQFAVESAGEAAEEIPVDELNQILPMLSGIVVNVEIDVDTASYLPIHMHMDLEGTDWTTIGAVFAQYAQLTNDDGSLMSVSINVPELYIDYVYDYDAAVDVTVPEEALAAAAAE